MAFLSSLFSLVVSIRKERGYQEEILLLCYFESERKEEIEDRRERAKERKVALLSAIPFSLGLLTEEV